MATTWVATWTLVTRLIKGHSKDLNAMTMMKLAADVSQEQPCLAGEQLEQWEMLDSKKLSGEEE